MADRLHLRVVALLAILVVVEPTTSLFEVDADDSKDIHKLDQGNSFKNTSDGISESELEVQNLHNPNVFSKEERNHEDVYHPKLPGRRVGGLTSTAASIPGERSEENIEESFENISNEFPPKESKKMLDSDEHKHNKMLSRTTAGKSSEKSGHILSKIQPTISKTVESDLETKDSKVLLKQDKMVEMPSSQLEEQSLPKGNDVESDNIGLVDSLTTLRPVVSTIALLTGVLNGMHTNDNEPFTQLQKLQIESADEHEKKAILRNAVESQENFIRAEDNFLDENVNPKVNMPQPTEQYQAAVRVTDHSTLREAGPEGNEVISADVEFLHADGLHYQKDGNIIPEGATAAENETDNTHILSFSEPRKTLDAVVQINYPEANTQPYPSTPLPTMWPHFVESDLPHGTAVIKDYVTLEAKARTETERILMAGGGIKQTNDQERPSAQPGKGPSITQKNAIIGSAPPGLVMSTTVRAPVTKPQDPVAETQHPQLAESATIRVFPNGSKKNGRRGEIRVTTQRAFRRPQLIDVPTSFTSMRSTLETPICNKNGGTCEFVGTNKTLLKWDDLRHTLSFAWDMHVYGTGSLFLLLSLIALVNLIGSPILQVTYLPYVIVANGLLFAIGILRGVFFLLDPYGTKGKISRPIALVLCNVTFPLMISTFATLVLLVLKIARLQLLPPKFQSLALLAVIAVIHFIVLLSADLLTHLLNPSVNMVLQILSISWGIFLMVGNFVAYYRLRKSSKDIVNETQRVSPVEDIAVVQTQGRSIKCMFTSSRVLLVSSVFGLLCCGMQVYAILWLYGLLGQKNEFFWSWWFLQFWYRIFELVLCFSMIFVASHSFCLQCSSSDHTCWSKIISYFCTYKKTEAPEYPNNCYDWTNGLQDKMSNNNISKSIIRNQAENVPLRIIKENNETKGPGIGNNSRSSSPLFRPKPDVVFAAKSQNVTMGRSYTSICFEKESMLSLADLEFRPPSPINLSRSIDEALFREHLVRDSIFLDSSLQYPSYLTRQDSCSSLKECSAMNQTIDPLISADLKMRRCSNPDYLYSLADGSSTTELDSQSESTQQSKELPRDVTTEPVASVSSIDSISKGSIKISWNPWRHGLSSVESLPLEDSPSSQLLKQGSQPSIMSKSSEPEKSFGRRFMEKSQTTDSNSIASETIEL
ncbi:proline-rich transmembrane protein 3 isoform X2 [Rana temporaria]|uniref:proline-rich transmembrane protein 3 isoform X2 n=1 Tax=Rana temporaria TaxID=8407 RepID=UPI001AAD7D6A|nr:proline-rich transmembrane protein 3 isoform X2 [Rana temporaria]